nr:hypothetical protein [Tanacetum cinerariifolium]
PMVPGLAGGEWLQACGSRGKWWSGAENREDEVTGCTEK